MRSPLVKILIAVLVIVVLVAIAIPLFVNGESFRPMIQSRLSAALNRKVSLGHLSFSLFSGSLVADDLSIADDPAFSSSPFLNAKELRVGVEIGPLVFHKELHVTGLTIDTPAIQLIQNESGRWNYSSIGSGGQSAGAQSGGATDISINSLELKNGSASVSAVPPTTKPVVYTNVDATAKQFSFTNNFPFDLSATLPANGSLKINGNAGPVAQQDASETPFHANIEIAKLDPVAAGLIEANKGISGLVNMQAQINSDGSTLTTNGKITADRLQLSRAGSPAPQPVNATFNVTTNLRARMGTVNNLVLQSGSAAAHVNGGFRMTPKAILLDLHLSAPGLSVDQLEQMLPALGIKVPAGSQLKGGTITATLTITGPATETTIAGPVDVQNTHLAGFDLGSKIQGLGALTGTSGGTDIQKLSAALNAGPETTAINNIDCVVPSIGTATGSGTVSPSGALDFKLTATLNNNNLVGAVTNQAINQVTSQVQSKVGGLLGGILGGGKQSQQSATPNSKPQGIPLVITGTTSSPQIRANVGALLH